VSVPTLELGYGDEIVIDVEEDPVVRSHTTLKVVSKNIFLDIVGV
jgi:hypothetical protein